MKAWGSSSIGEGLSIQHLQVPRLNPPTARKQIQKTDSEYLCLCLFSKYRQNRGGLK